METINLSKKQFVIYMAVAFGLAWILEMIASIFSNNGNQMVFAVILMITMFMPFLGVLIARIPLKGMGWVPHLKETSLCILCPLDAGVIKYPWRSCFCDFPGYI